MRAALLAVGLWASGMASCSRAEPAAPAPAPVPASPTVSFEALGAFLPRALAGYEPVRDRGSTGKYGDVSVSEAERAFSRSGAEVSIRIVDTTLGPRLRSAIRAAVLDATDRPAEDPTAPILTDSAVGFVRYDAETARAEANLLVGDRFVVVLVTEGISGTGELRRLARGLDLAGLAKLR